METFLVPRGSWFGVAPGIHLGTFAPRFTVSIGFAIRRTLGRTLESRRIFTITSNRALECRELVELVSRRGRGRLETDGLGSPSAGHPRLDHLTHSLEELVVLLAGNLLVEDVKLDALQTHTSQAVRAVLALDAQGQVAGGLACPAVLGVAAGLASQ
jgi:hypothetical protein